MSMETYTPGYSTSTNRFMQQRQAHRQAAFFLPELQAGWHVLDVGCGPGSITVGLAQAIAPGKMVAFDQEASQLKRTLEAATAAGLSNVECRSGSVYEMPFPDGTFNAVFSHAVFEHLSRPADALMEIYRVLRPSGLVALRSPDWGGFLVHPATALLTEALDFYQKVQRSNGGDIHAGRKLKDWISQAGFEGACWTAEFDFINDLAGITEYLACQIELASDHTTRLGFDRRRIPDWAQTLRRLREYPGAVFAGSWGCVIGRKGGR